ncbi:MAG: flagellar export protein FliJ [Oscillospiraceae bacterium]|jgi:flagellar FliJ protein|nr:flagellar export protein FliJ [Oscillospiraceae bacterium]
MKKFSFTLQSVLNVKRAQEKQRMGELAECNARIRENRRLLQESYDHQQAQNVLYQREYEDGMKPYRLRMWGWAMNALRDRIAYRKKVLETAEGELARIQKALVTVMQERKMLESLREKQMEEYRAEERRENDAVIAEFVGFSAFGDGERPQTP